MKKTKYIFGLSLMTKKTKQRKTHLYMPGIDEADPVPDFSPQDLYLIASWLLQSLGKL